MRRRWALAAALAALLLLLGLALRNRTAPPSSHAPLPSPVVSTSRPPTARSPRSAEGTLSGKPAEIATLTGKVTWKETGQPVRGARVLAASRPGSDLNALPSRFDVLRAHADTDEEGRYRLEIPLGPEGFQRYLLRVRSLPPRPREFESYLAGLPLRGPQDDIPSLLGKLPVDSLTFPPLRPGEERVHDVALVRGLGFRFELRRSDDGQPVSGNLSFSITIPSGSGEALCVGSGGGMLSEGRYETGLFFHDLDCIREGIAHLYAGRSNLDLALRDFPLVDGYVHISAAIDPKPSVAVRPKEIVATPPGEAAATPSAWILEGRVVDSAGKPVPGADVWAYFEGKDPPDATRAKADDQGRYRFEILSRNPGLTIQAFPQHESTHWYTWKEGAGFLRDSRPDSKDGAPGIGWKSLPPGLPALDITLNSSTGLQTYPSR